MTFKKQFVYALLTAVLAGIITYVTQLINGWPVAILVGNANPLTFITFVVWACYFVCGCTPKAALNWWLSMAVGIVAGILMFVLTFAFMGAGMGYLPAVSIAVVILVVFMMFTDKAKCNTAGVFVGTGLFFALNAAGALGEFKFADYAIVGAAELLYAALGLVAGWLTIQFNILASKMK